MRLVFEDGERAALVTQLGLDENADEAALVTAVTERLTAQQQQPNNTGNPDLAGIGDDQDIVVIDVAEFTRLRGRDRVAGEVERTLAVRDRDELIEEAIHDGKISPGRRDHYKKKYESDPEGVKKLLGALTNKSVPVEVLGRDAPTDEVDQTSYPAEMFPEIAARQQQQRNDSRIHSEVD